MTVLFIAFASECKFCLVWITWLDLELLLFLNVDVGSTVHGYFLSVVFYCLHWSVIKLSNCAFYCNLYILWSCFLRLVFGIMRVSQETTKQISSILFKGILVKMRCLMKLAAYLIWIAQEHVLLSQITVFVSNSVFKAEFSISIKYCFLFFIR